MEKYHGSPAHIKSALIAQKKALEKLQELKQQRIDNYNKNPTLCKTCSNFIEYNKRTNKFCNSSCAASFNNSGRIHTKETKLKISEKVKHTLKERRPSNPPVLIECKQCYNIFQVSYGNRDRIFCSITCQHNYQKRPEYIEYLSQRGKEIAQRPEFKGWTCRKMKPSYPEQYFIKVLDNGEWQYIPEYKVGKYFIDFAFENVMVALEIDGKQHKRPDYAERDRRKDKLLIENGWTVFRIDWVNPINDKNKEILYTQIQKFKELLNKKFTESIFGVHKV